MDASKVYLDAGLTSQAYLLEAKHHLFKSASTTTKDRMAYVHFANAEQSLNKVHEFMDSKTDIVLALKKLCILLRLLSQKKSSIHSGSPLAFEKEYFQTTIRELRSDFVNDVEIISIINSIEDLERMMDVSGDFNFDLFEAAAISVGETISVEGYIGLSLKPIIEREHDSIRTVFRNQLAQINQTITKK
jgi:hypothetical protein